MASGQIPTGSGAFGGVTTGTDRATTITYGKATTAITAKRVVALDLANSGQIIQAATGTAALLCLGISAENIAAGGFGGVINFGPVFSVLAQGAIAAGDRVTRSGTTAGAVASLAASTGVTTEADLGQVIGIAMSAASGNLVDVYVVKF